MSNFSEKFKELMDERGLTASELAKVSGIAKSKLFNWLKYGALPSTKSLITAARFFGCPVDFFIGRTNEIEIVFSDKPVDFKDRLSELIEQKKITPYRVCKELHLETAMMTDWTRKGTLPNFDNLIMLTDYFNCSADYLLGLSEDK